MGRYGPKGCGRKCCYPTGVGIRNMGKYNGTWNTVEFDRKQRKVIYKKSEPVLFQCLMSSPDFPNLLAEFPVSGLKLICENNDDSKSDRCRIMAGDTVLYECESLIKDEESDPEWISLGYPPKLVGDFQKVPKARKKLLGLF